MCYNKGTLKVKEAQKWMLNPLKNLFIRMI